MAKEGSLDAPQRHPLDWQNPDFYDAEALESEMRRVFDVCHGCRRCFNLCESFPRLFDLIDSATSGELDTVETADFPAVVEACTLCDMCFMTKCPYVPPHPFNIDFPHLMLRARAVDRAQEKGSWVRERLTHTDQTGKLGSALAPLANWTTKTDNKITRPVIEATVGIDRRADLPRFYGKTFLKCAENPPSLNEKAPGFGEKVLLYATCFVNYNNPPIGEAALQVLSHNGVETQVLYPECCGMPQWEQGNLETVAKKAQRITKLLIPWIERGYTIVSPIPSCSLMLKTEWPLLWPEDTSIKKLAENTQDLSEYLVKLQKRKGLTSGLQSLPEGITVHIPCHARAQNQGRKAEELLKLLPDTPLHTVERCSGHGGSWGIFKGNFDLALKVGRPAARQILKNSDTYCVSECPLAARHLYQEMEVLTGQPIRPQPFTHPIQAIAHAYGFETLKK